MSLKTNPADSRLCVEALKAATYWTFEPVVVETLADAISSASNTGFDVILLDLGMFDSDGLDAIQKLPSELVDVKFVQVGPAYVADQVGTGLGLSLCKNFVELHGGMISLDSVEGEGTTAPFVLPPERVRKASVIALPSQEERRLRQLWR